jgi:hypothetical protein
MELPGRSNAWHANMKIKLWTFEYEFDRDDAKIVVPIILLALAFSFTSIDRTALLAVAVAYYLIYFFAAKAVESIERWREQLKMRCPKCKNRKIYLQGYDTYNSDAHHPYYFCDSCKTTSVLTDRGMLKI